jgi:exosome complex protein LRP1
MDVSDISPDLETLDSQLDNLDDALKPLMGDLSDISSQLPLLDKVKLYTLVTYSIESLLFCMFSFSPPQIAVTLSSCADAKFTASLQLSGVDAKDHAVFQELKRVRQYFGKIKALEEPEKPRTVSVNAEAATRIIRADLVSVLSGVTFMHHQLFGMLTCLCSLTTKGSRTNWLSRLQRSEPRHC